MARIRHERPAGVDLAQQRANLFADELDDFFFIEEVDFALGGVDIDIDASRINLEAEVDERLAAFGQECSIGLLDTFLDGRRFDRPMIDEE